MQTKTKRREPAAVAVTGELTFSPPHNEEM
jgi:hypothetical protein